MARRRGRRGIVGIEAAIVMIAFVIVAAALAFVALNMGMTATQKTKEAIGASMGEAGSALMVDGDVIADVTTTGTVDAIVIPIRSASGKYPIDLNPGRTTISLYVNDNYYANIYTKIYNATVTDPVDVSTLITNVKGTGTTPNATIVFIKTFNSDYVLEYGEKALVVVYLGSTGASPYHTVKVEIKPPEGSPLLVERTIPPSLPGGGGLTNLG